MDEFNAEGDFPDPLSPIIFSEPANLTKANISPYSPVICGSHIGNTRAAAIAASTALPPFSRALSAVFDAMG
jgi:hypothetical protein